MLQLIIVIYFANKIHNFIIECLFKTFFESKDFCFSSLTEGEKS